MRQRSYGPDVSGTRSQPQPQPPMGCRFARDSIFPESPSAIFATVFRCEVAVPARRNIVHVSVSWRELAKDRKSLWRRADDETPAPATFCRALLLWRFAGIMRRRSQLYYRKRSMCACSPSGQGIRCWALRCQDWFSMRRRLLGSLGCLS